MTAPIRSMPELIDALKARRDELNISHETIDHLAGLQSGYASKLFAPTPMKNLGPMSFAAVLGALGMALVAVPDPAAIVLVESRWKKRKRPQKLPSASTSASIVCEAPAQIQITPELQAKLGLMEHMKRIANLGGKRRAKVLGKRARQRIATHAARMRWAKTATK